MRSQCSAQMGGCFARIEDQAARLAIPRAPRIELEQAMDFAPVSLSGTSDGKVDSVQSQNHNFMLRVQAAIGPKHLDGHGQTGRVLLAFSISGTGQLVGVRLAQSSGVDKLDSMAM